MHLATKKTLAATTLAFIMIGGMAAAHAADPTQGRINKRVAERQQQYFKCADFSLRVLNACTSQAGNNVQKARSCRNHYQGNLARCRSRFL